ncbi:MAG TPA: hypothetical protein VLC46_09575 [Thermoanaerobaculia bacterium]|jgi:hypothetical protein|nr:hypothetical protein [Thermoanaerobaculia bacterium]
MRNPAIGAILIVLFAGLASAHASETQLSQTTPDPKVSALPNRLRTSVASSGRGYLVAWEATADVSSDTTTIYIRALDADGVPAQPSAVLLGLGREPRIAWNGHEYLVVWGITTPTSGPLPTPSVVGVRVREDGSLIDAQPVTIISEVNPFSTTTTVVWSGSQYLVTWARGMALVDPDLHAKIVLLPSVGGTPTYTATSGGSFLVLTTVFHGFFIETMYLFSISPDGDLGTPVLLNSARANMAAVDGGYAMIWDDGATLHVSRLQLNGEMISTSNVGEGSVGFPRIAARDGRIVASWESFPASGPNRVCTVRLDAIGLPDCSAPSAGLQHDPSIALSSTSTLLVWSDQSFNYDSVRVAMTRRSDLPRAEAGAGLSISDASIPVPAAEARNDGTVPAAWSEYNQRTGHFEVHLGARSSHGGSLPESAVFPTALDQTSPAIAAGAGRTMVLWAEGPPSSSKIRVTIVDDSSKAVIATLPLGAGIAPSTAFDGKEWLVTWLSSAASGNIQFAVVNGDGHTIDSGMLPALSFIPSVPSAPAVAWSGKVFFVTWRESVTGPKGESVTDLIGVVTVNAAGVSSLPLTLDSADPGLALPSVASNGGRVLVSWGAQPNTLRQALFDDTGKQLGNFINVAWPYSLSHTRTRAMAGGFATLAGSRIALTSSGGLPLDTIDVQPVSAGGDFVVDSSNRLTFVYSRGGTAGTATFAQTVGLPRRRP